jgi:hypothetical protein
MKMGPDALGTAEKESGRTNHENGTRRPPTDENESGSAKNEIGTDAFCTVENESGSTKHKNGTQRTRYRRK